MFKPIALALAAALTMAALPAMAQSAKPAPIDLKIDAAAHAQGAKEVPAVVTAAGTPCTVTDGYFIGAGDSKDEAGKPIKVKSYEAACKEGLGYVFIAPAVGTPKHYDCISLLDSPSVRCRLPANVDPKIQLGPVVAQTGQTCTINQARGLGSTVKGDSFYEVGCAGTAGFIVETHASAAPEAIDCTRTVGTNLECKFTSKDALEAQRTALVQGLMAQSGKPCQLTASRTIGTTSNGDNYYEAACGKDGYFVQTSKSGAFIRTIPCANAGGMGGGCKLTDAVAAESSESGLYSKLAKGAGFNCDVAKYRYIGIVGKNDELVELACTNRADGAMAIFPDDKGTAPTFYDCVRAGAVGQECRLSSPSVVYDKYTAALAARGKTTCKVSNATWVGTSPTNHTDFVETACSDGLPGWVVEMTKSGQAKSVLTCGEARGAGISCKLPGNAR